MSNSTAELTIPSDLEVMDFNRQTANALGVKIHDLEVKGRGYMAEVYAEVHGWLNDKLVVYPALGDLKEVSIVECITARFCDFAGCSHTRYVYLNENVSSVSKTASEHGYPRDYMRGAEEVFKQIRAYPELFEAHATWEDFSAAKSQEKKDPKDKEQSKLATTILALLGSRVGDFDGDDEISKLANVLVRDIRKACTA